jgi:hypothetical protein
MGGGKTTCEHQSTNNSEVLLVEHSLQVWGSQRTDCSQWETVRLLHFQRILQNIGHSGQIFVSVPPTVQRSS